MDWSFLASWLVGFCIGFRYRVPALIAATVLIAGSFGLARAVGVDSTRSSAAYIVLLLVVLQCGYLLGLVVSIAIKRADHS